jgi:hypothetical protein
LPSSVFVSVAFEVSVPLGYRSLYSSLDPFYVISANQLELIGWEGRPAGRILLSHRQNRLQRADRNQLNSSCLLYAPSLRIPL